ncbi:MAG: hypothetical protein JWN04_3810 [Myxococcaceae bacterium]|nr:hypothetical protein [Myxococcaceae bacterium]
MTLRSKVQGRRCARTTVIALACSALFGCEGGGDPSDESSGDTAPAPIAQALSVQTTAVSSTVRYGALSRSAPGDTVSASGAYGALAGAIAASGEGQHRRTSVSAVARKLLPDCPCLLFGAITVPPWSSALVLDAIGNPTLKTGTVFPEAALCGYGPDQAWVYLQRSDSEADLLFVQQNKVTDLGDGPVCGAEWLDSGPGQGRKRLLALDELEYISCRAEILSLQAKQPELSCQ